MAPAAVAGRLLRIGEIAELAGVSTRTIRFYEQTGLLPPAVRSEGGARRYEAGVLARLERIRELQDLLGFNLEEIARVLHADDALGELRSEFEGGVSPGRHRELVEEAQAINRSLREVVAGKLAALQGMVDDLEASARRYEERLAELDAGRARR